MAEDKVMWFENGNHRINLALKSPDETFNFTLAFKRKYRRMLRKGHFKQEKEEYHIATTKVELEEQINEIRAGPNVQNAALEGLDNAEKTHKAYFHDRQHGPKKLGRWGQEFANTFAEFLEAYSCIVDVVRSAGGQYAEVAYQTLSILLVARITMHIDVVVNKSNNDKKIISLLGDLRKSFPRLDSWNQMYPTDTMRDLVATVYTQVTDFSMAVVRYFTHFWTRLWVALISPPSMGIDKITASIHQNLAQISAEAMYGLHDRSQNIELEVVASGKTIQKLETEAGEASRAMKRMEATNEELLLSLNEQREKMNAYIREVERKEAQQDEQQLRAFREELGIEYPLPETDIETTRRTLMQNFPNAKSYFERTPATGYIQMTPNLLCESKEYQSWLSYPGSSLLFINGATAADGRQFKGLYHCWLSPATIYIADKLEKEQQRYIFYSCHPGIKNEFTKSAQHIFASIILQLLERKPQILREKGVQYRRAVSSKSWHNNEDIMIQTMMQTIQDILLDLQELGPIYIVIDRLDIYEGKLHVIVDKMVRLVNTVAASCRVKFVVVSETTFGRGQWHPEYLPEDEIEYNLDGIFVLKLDQRRRLNHELSSGHFPLAWGAGLP